VFENITFKNIVFEQLNDKIYQIDFKISIASRNNF